eukprot:82252-Chlamydomonas_euryale.AAC.1
MCGSGSPAPHGHHAWHSHFKTLAHHLPFHHPYWDYFFFAYTWSSEPPYEVTGVSHAFIPHDSHDHQVGLPVRLTPTPRPAAHNALV